MNYLQALRQVNGFTITSLAKKLNIRRENLSRIENGHYKPGPVITEALEKFFNESIEHLLSEIPDDEVTLKIL